MSPTQVTIERILAPTLVVEPGMHVRDVFVECNRAHIQALPYRDQRGRLSGRVTLKNVLRVSCLPEYMVGLAALLGPQLSCVDSAEAKAREIMRNPIDPYVQPIPKTIDSDAPLIKALAVMEQHDTSYIFVVDDGEYRGVITIQAIAHLMTEL